MKKVLSVVISILLLVALLGVVSVSAASGVTLSTSTVSANRGDTVSVTVKVTANSGFSFLMITPSYDSSALTLVETVNGNVCGSMTNGKNPNWNGNGQNVTATGTLVTFKFQVSSSAAIKDHNVGITVRQCYDAASANVPCSATGGVVKVVCAAHNYSDQYSKVSDTQHQRVCTICNHADVANHSWDKGTVTQQATCKEAGTKVYTCTAKGCGATKTENLSKTEQHTFGAWATTKEATCTAAGNQSRSCSVCGKTENKEIAATGHSYGNWKTTKEATCTAKGIQTGTCSKCSGTTTKEIAATGHSYGNWKTTKQATCTAKGTKVRTCSKCSGTDTKEIAVTGHDYGSWKVTQEATTEQAGTRVKTCSSCGKQVTETIPMLQPQVTETTEAPTEETTAATEQTTEATEETTLATEEPTEPETQTTQADTVAPTEEVVNVQKQSNLWWLWIILVLIIVVVVVVLIVKKRG